MKTPETYREWLADVQDAFQSACQRSQSRPPPLSNLTELFNTAAPIAAERRHIVDPDQIQEMTEYVQEQVEADLKNGAELSDYMFHFVISYIHAHTPAGILTELEADKIMAYVNDHWNLFDEHA